MSSTCIVSMYDALAELDLDIDSVEVSRRELQVSEQFRRTTSILEFHGGGETGKGEDIIYESSFHQYPDTLLDALPGSYSFGEFSAFLEDCSLFEPDAEPDLAQRGHREIPAKRNYRRWALESAALDLALKQHGETLASVLDREYSPVKFVVSPSNDEQTPAYIEALIDEVPDVELKLNATESWDRETMSEIASFGRTRVVDFKSHHDELGVGPEYELYAQVADVFDNATLEDPVVTPETRGAFEGAEDRVSWDEPIHGIESIKSLPFTPSQLNIKPSRFGTVESLIETIAYCFENDIDLYGGGQFELGIGREHIHALASLFYSDAPNDVAPRVYNGSGVPANPPESPLVPQDDVAGLSWRAETDDT